jgi:apolipoprotein N-acyltransferase
MRLSFSVVGLVAALASGVLVAMAFPPFEEPVLGWVGLMPVVWALHARRMRWWQLWAGGFLCWILQLWWVGHVTWVGTALLCTYLGLYWVAWGRWMALVFSLFPERNSSGNLACALLGATGWTALEEVRGWLFSGFPWNNLGVSQYKNAALVQTASVGGVELLGWVMMVVQLVFALTALRLIREVRGGGRMRAHWEFTGALALLGVVFIHGVMCLVPEPRAGAGAPPVLSMGLVQGNVPQEVKFSPMSLEETVAAYTAPTAALAGAQPDVIVWPETATGVGIFQEAFVRAEVTGLVQEHGVTLLAGTVEEDEDGSLYNAAVLLAPGLEEGAVRAAAYKKQHLVPYGEFLPGRKWFPWLWSWLDMPLDYKPGPRSRGVMLLPGREVSPLAGLLICFEDIMPHLARARAEAGAHLLVNLTNDGWFRDSPAAYVHMTNAVFRAVENRLPLVRVTNTGVSCVVSPEGIVTNILQDDEGRHTAVAGAMVARVPIPERRGTFYQARGHLFGDACAVVMGVVLLLRVRWRGLVGGGRRD